MFNIAACAQDLLYPPRLAEYAPVIQRGRWNTLLLRSLHIDGNARLHYNAHPVVEGGAYVGSALWPSQLWRLLNPAGNCPLRNLLISVGDQGGRDFRTIQDLYQSSHRSFAGTGLARNFDRLYRTLGAVDGIDLAADGSQDPKIFVAFARMLAELGYALTFSPTGRPGLRFWIEVLAQMEHSHPGRVRWWNLPCDSDGQAGSAAGWAQALQQAMPGLNTDGYLLVGHRAPVAAAPVPESRAGPSQGDHADAWWGAASIGGRMLWNLDELVGTNDAPAVEPEGPAKTSGRAQRVRARRPVGV